MPPTSAARWKTNSGRTSSKRRTASSSRVRSYSRRRATKGSRPSATSRSTRCEPRNPPPPVTSTRMPQAYSPPDRRRPVTKRKAFITGITGQDGSYLAEILLEKDYEVYGMIRRSSSFNTARIDHVFGEIELVFGDLADGSVLNQLMRTIRPDEVYNLGAQSHVRVSFDIPES